MIHNNVLKRLFQILDLYTINDYKFGVNDVAQKLNVNISTASRMMADLQEMGVLKRSDTHNKYLLGDNIAKLAFVYFSTLDLKTISMPYLVELSKKTNFGARIHIIEGDKRCCIAWVDSSQPVRHVMSPDAVYGPLHAGAPGILLLASLPDEKVREIMGRTGFTKYTNNTINSIEDLETEIHKIRENGLFISRGEHIDYLSTMATSIKNHSGNVIAAISLTALSAQMVPELEEQYSELLKKAAENISQKLGYMI